MNRINRILIAAALLAAVFSAGCGQKPPEPKEGLEFKAVMVIEDKSGSVEKEVNFTRDMQRIKTIPSGSWIVIVRLDRGVVWTLMPENKLFLEKPLLPQHKNPLIYLPDDVGDYERLGEEEQDGHPTVKERFVMSNEGDTEKAIVRWFATDIGWPIRAEAEDGSWKLYYKDIKTGGQDPAMFEIPKGFNMLGAQRPPGAQ